ncbi:hypothetical protein C8J35_107273 [Rhizobium sp. PP-F2F-G38]|uniref:Uncharacterized protein n=1 Tax=Ferranicluibacter rubi TaxID=2715133 RepID=A0AA44CBR9_9HYPH|nr:hypothetical protein [Ferranicluibacter rubi]PYE32685.1 hypothetical protein C8J37_107272 [Rhizobium sp. PP-WC-1G-195]PYE96114.1 hypothetical protein C8J35_107273 [Rhizobium sp. PP-F2F-G38]TCQ08885.1 hypothetical protein C8J34_103273 [Rhizobium sp. PP-F2F-G36]TCQ23054.1 hypothetical protein C8J33_105273 [Rhizobium sp. PP-CC-3G-465]NHT75636.1 hypothetical protein [Ferranicluibacter rubi]
MCRLLALGGIVGDLFSWATFLTAVVPPIGGIIVADYYVVRAHSVFLRGHEMRFNAAALIALGVAVAATLFIWFYLLDIVTPLVGAPLAGFLYLALAAIAPDRLGVGLGRGSLGAEAVD